jgi:hypothetical protein
MHAFTNTGPSSRCAASVRQTSVPLTDRVDDRTEPDGGSATRVLA